MTMLQTAHKTFQVTVLKGKCNYRNALNIKIIDNAINNSFGLDLIIGAIAAIAVAPHMQFRRYQ